MGINGTEEDSLLRGMAMLPIFSTDEFGLQDALAAGQRGWALPVNKEGEAHQAQLYQQDERGRWIALTRAGADMRRLPVEVAEDVDPVAGMLGVIVWDSANKVWRFGVGKEWRSSFIKRTPTDLTKFPKRIYLPKDRNAHIAALLPSPDPAVSEWAASFVGKEFDGVGIIPVTLDGSVDNPSSGFIGKVTGNGSAWTFSKAVRLGIHAGEAGSLSKGKSQYPINNTTADLVWDDSKQSWVMHFVAKAWAEKFPEGVTGVSLYGETPPLNKLKDRYLRGAARKDSETAPWMWAPTSLKNAMASTWAYKNPELAAEKVASPRERKGTPSEGLRQGATVSKVSGLQVYVVMKASVGYDVNKDVPVEVDASILNPEPGMSGAVEWLGGKWLFMKGMGGAEANKMRGGTIPFAIPSDDYSTDPEKVDLSDPKKGPVNTLKSPSPEKFDPTRPERPLDSEIVPGINEPDIFDVEDPSGNPVDPTKPKFMSLPKMPAPGSPEWLEKMKKKTNRNRIEGTFLMNELTASIADLLSQDL